MYTLLILNAAVMRLNEIMGLEQSRAWGVCSLNDFRKFLGLKSKVPRRLLLCRTLSFFLRQLSPASSNGIQILRLPMLPRSCMAILIISSFMLVYRPKRPNLLLRVQAFALVSPGGLLL